MQNFRQVLFTLKCSFANFINFTRSKIDTQIFKTKNSLKFHRQNKQKNNEYCETAKSIFSYSKLLHIQKNEQSILNTFINHWSLTKWNETLKWWSLSRKVVIKCVYHKFRFHFWKKKKKDDYFKVTFDQLQSHLHFNLSFFFIQGLWTKLARI